MPLLQGCAAARSVGHPSASATVERSRRYASSRVWSTGSGFGRGGLGLPNREAAEESARSTRRVPLTSHRLVLVSATDAFIARVLFTRERSCSCASRIQRVSESSLHTRRQRQRCLSRQARSRVRRRQRVQRPSPGVTASASVSPGCFARRRPGAAGVFPARKTPAVPAVFAAGRSARRETRSPRTPEKNAWKCDASEERAIRHAEQERR